MRLTKYFIPTYKEIPAEAEIVSHQLMLRAGLIRKLTSGIYTYLPAGLRALKKVENIIREEMNRSGAIEILMPAVQPAELWEEITATLTKKELEELEKSAVGMTARLLIQLGGKDA